ncbi:crAss001_48 related protein [Klebsiella pneumoniae]|uniref:crAss001_48 related protein n=1 Tax=Klebsiella pneumoniae TaxID=573 RepID=UPI0039E1E4DC
MRVLEELTQLSEKLEKLNNFINGDSSIFNGLDPEEQKRLRDQSNFMTEYQTVLAQRVAAF